MPPNARLAKQSSKPALLMSRPEELENSRLGVIFFLGNLQVDFSPEDGASKLKDKALDFVKSKVSNAKVIGAANKVGDMVDSVDRAVDDIAMTIQQFLIDTFKFDPSDADLAVQALRYQLPSLISSITGAVGNSADDYTGKSGAKGIASGLYTAVSKTVEGLQRVYQGWDVNLESGHPDIIASSIKKSLAMSALVGLSEAALAGAKYALAAFTGGVGLIINKVADVIEALIRFAVRFCDARNLRRIFADARAKWASRGQSDAIQTHAGQFAEWFKKVVGKSPIVAALVMNCGIAGDAMRFLQVTTSSGVIITQGQFDKGVTYLNGLKSSATDLILEIQDNMRIWSSDQMCSALLKHAAEIGLVQKEAGSSWRARIFGWSHQQGKKAQALNWVLDKVGYKQSTPMRV